MIQKSKYQLILIANIKKSISIPFMKRKLIKTGLFLKLQQELKYYFFLKKNFKKSISIIHFERKKNDLTLYKEIKIILINVFFKTMIIESNEKLIMLNIFLGNRIKWEKCSTLNISKRGSNGFGSTGI
ncbi:dCTP deaminase/dUTPase family protein [Blattabacterium cuenoti]|uniref:dUTP diphosphatase n=1 Tax=Blattabacterium cuenoti TaxID=1653831 RepID=UPI001EEA1DA0|nr:dUTP diphosphatase [Blattabacterium cuenoti]